MKLLLIDSRIDDKQTVIDSLLSDTTYIIIDYFIDTFQSIKDKIYQLNINNFINVGIFQENDINPIYQFIKSFQCSILNNVETSDPQLNSWSNFYELLIFLKTDVGMQNLDIMDCNIYNNKNWIYVINRLSENLLININASTNETGNSAMNGDWILEYGNVNLIGFYFTDNIKNYKYILGGSSNANHSLIIDVNGSVYACGRNLYGQLGNGNTTQSTTLKLMTKPVALSTEVKAINISAGAYHSLVLYDNGSVYACGWNYDGQLGNGTTTDSNTLILMTKPDALSTEVKAINISAGGYYSLVLYDNGSVYACGSNAVGQLGNGGTGNSNTLILMTKPAGLTAKAINISAGGSHSLVLYDNGSVYACGYNLYGRLGNGNTTQSNTLIPMTKPVALSTEVKAINISTGNEHSQVLYDNRLVYACGRNNSGQLGDNTNNNSNTLIPMKYTNNNQIVDFDKASIKTFLVILIKDNLQKLFDGTDNLSLSNTDYQIYSYIPNKEIIVPNYTAKYNSINIRNNIQITIDILEDLNYSFVKQYTRFGTIISNLSQYINIYTNINIFKKIIIVRLNNKYAILYMNKKVFVVQLS